MFFLINFCLLLVNIGGRSSSKPIQKSMGNGKQTMRLGKGKVEDKDDVVDIAVAKINSLLETFMGIHDSDLGKINKIFYFFYKRSIITYILKHKLFGKLEGII